MKTLAESIETLKTACTFIDSRNEYFEPKLAELVGAMNLLCKAELLYRDENTANDEQASDTYYQAIRTEKLKLIQLISNL